MSAGMQESDIARSPLELLLRDYVETAGGVWDEVEPQVYDVLLPPAARGEARETGERDVVRVAFDLEAVPEHPGAQLASFGTPLVDRVLADAMQRGRYAQLYLLGLNLAPYDLAERTRRALTLPAKAELEIERARALHFAQALYWFEASFISDQKQQELLPVAIDLYYGRQVRHHERLLDAERLAGSPSVTLPESRGRSVAAGYRLSRDRAVRTVSGLANARLRELIDRTEPQIERMRRYYADLERELEEQARRADSRGGDVERFVSRRAALEREARLRISELRQKTTLRVDLRLLNVLVVQQPKLLLAARLNVGGASPQRLELIWDPLIEALEAVPCPQCGSPTYAFEPTRLGRPGCPACAGKPLQPK